MAEGTDGTGSTIGPDRIDTRADLGPGDAGTYAFYLGEDNIAGKEETKWHKRGRKVIQRYRDERPQTGPSVHRMNILWSNVQTLIPTLYARTPKADVQRRWLDQDDTGRLASLLLERAIGFSLENSDFDSVMAAVVQDRLLPGRGVPRVMYIPHYGDPIEPAPSEEFDDEDAAPTDVDNPGDKKSEPLREVVYEEAVASYIFWEDYREAPARTWREVAWIRYRAYMTRDQLIDRFGSRKGKLVNLDFTPKGGDQHNPDKSVVPPDIFKKAIIHEYWDKTKSKVVWLAPGTPDIILDEVDDPLRLPGFFPNPDPLLATTTNDKRIPVPDYTEYQDQANELDTLTGRIDTLTRALKVSGVYPGTFKQTLQQLIDEGTENKLIPVEDWAAWMDKGGLANFIQWLPIKEVADTLIQLYAARDKTKDLLYEITGIGDIMRGQTNPNETMGAQQLKANFSTRRIQPQQRAVARIARDTIRLIGGIIAEHFSNQTISMITGYPQLVPVPPVPPEPPAMLPPMMGHNGGPPMAPPYPVSAGQQPPPSPVIPSVPGTAPPGPPMPTGMMAPGQAPASAPPQMQPNPAHVQWQQTQQASQAAAAANQQKQSQFEAACELIRKDGIRGFKLDIEADSTIAADEQAEQNSRIAFLKEIVPLVEQITPIAQGNPAMAAFVSEVVMFAIRGFRVARTLEDAAEKAFKVLGSMPPPSKGAGGANAAVEQAKIAADIHDTQTTAQTDMAETATKQQIAQMTLAQKSQQTNDQMAMERERFQAEQNHNAAQLALENERMRSTERLQTARVGATEARSGSGLV